MVTCFVRADHRRRQGEWGISRNNVWRGRIWIGGHEPRRRSIERSGRRRGIRHWGYARDHRRRGLRRNKRHTIVLWCLSPSIRVKRSGATRGARERRSLFFAMNQNGGSDAILTVREGVDRRAVDSRTNLMSRTEWPPFTQLEI